MASYKILRFKFEGGKPRVIKRGLTLEQAQEHCQKEETHKLDPKTGNVIWFDGYDEE